MKVTLQNFESELKLPTSLYYLHYTIPLTQPMVELVEWQAAESEVSGSNPGLNSNF